MPQMTEAPAVQASQLTMSYGDKTVLAGTSFTIPRGSVLALLGPNGAGKSTTIDILCGLKRRSSGYVRVLGIDPAHADEAWRARVGVVRQSWRDHERWRVGDLLHHLSQYYGTYSSSEAGWDPDELLRVVGLSSVAAKRIRTLSGGQRRRLDVAIGLVGNPDILFLDEPTTGFDTEARNEFHALIHALVARKTLTIVLTTHDLREAEELASHVIVLAEGTVRFQGTVEEFGQRVQVKDRISYTDRGEVHVLETPPDATVPTLKTLVNTAGESLENLEVRRATLEQLYLRITNEAAHSRRAAS